ncbi:MAG TPA: hypothetical protein VHL12_06110 [Gemmatimonadaceae bacterium]|nr:hypothetical protein [Gemmatimonadaceae bacterium]
MTRPTLLAAGLLLCLTVNACAPSIPSRQSQIVTPKTGIDVLRAMHDRYAGKWFRTLTFQQATTLTKPDGTKSVTTWYEAVRSPRLLRIDIGEPPAGNGVLYTPDSVIALRGGKVVRARAEGNPFLPFVVGVYTQPLDTTIAQLAPWKFDLSKVSQATFEGRPVYVVGADSGSDATPQFWVDADRLILVRMIVPLGPASPYDIRLLNYQKAGDSWVATHISMSQNGKEVQAEDYTDVRADTPLSPDLFDPLKWTTAPHWHTSTSSGSN